MDTKALLRRIGVGDVGGPPRLEELERVHEAFVDQVPYESIQYQLAPGTPLDLEESARRIIKREAGGYCFQLNGVLGVLLTELGYRVRLHRGGVETLNRPGEVDASHLVLTVQGLAEDPERFWLVDAGLGDGLIRPIPLETGRARQEPFELALRRSERVIGWRLDHDARASLIGMDFEDATVTLDTFAAKHAELSGDPQSPFRRTASAFRRKAHSVVVLRSVGRTEISKDRVDNSIIETPADYFALLADEFHLSLPQYGAAQRDQLWRRVWAQYEAYLTNAAG
ncbi:arylamine N-acetyltransferase [Kribbella sandramycini]|uniref:Arylamine N-acetyltransferase n=1 Tax=Kribbella sandramycini TaxID=60450 RepID=A0A7Y4P0B3_9ACTN|nr:arylamine N-acetyltransferase [Kribbella sandramycini]MBB6564770.1 arylamine N-acetyltransferase [Kribbella sandramycini]NOL42471.1 arylamine N-acetyltransferase [Kribbella sandramycini]